MDTINEIRGLVKALSPNSAPAAPSVRIKACEAIDAKLDTLEQAFAVLGENTVGTVSPNAFKDYVHKYLDDAGVPANPEPPVHAKEGCRVGDRLDWLLQKIIKETVDDLPYGNAPAPEPPKAHPEKRIRKHDLRKFKDYILMTDAARCCLYCAKPLAAEDATCPNCGWDGEYPITKAPIPPHVPLMVDIPAGTLPTPGPDAVPKYQGGVDLAKGPDYSVTTPLPGGGRTSFEVESERIQTTPFLKDDHKAAIAHTNRFGDDPPKPGRRPASVDPRNTNAHEERMLKWFTYDHLPPKLAAASAPWCELAVLLCHTTPPGPERTVALRKLLEGKDAAVRASLTPGG